MKLSGNLSQAWRRRVYHPRAVDDSISDWDKIKAKVLKRDHKKCIICGSNNLEEILTVHHIISRKLGGDEQLENLVTLCTYCHDGAEIEEFDNYEHFWQYVEEQKTLLENVQIVQKDESPDLDFHKWVYGGYRNPYKNKTNNELKIKGIKP